MEHVEVANDYANKLAIQLCVTIACDRARALDDAPIGR
jgi:hypothetical protein